MASRWVQPLKANFYYFMKQIELTRGKFALVDDADYEWLNQYKWQCDTKGYAVHYKLGKMHRCILGLTDPKVFTDHIDRNTLNNQRSNLRVATAAQNKQNTPYSGIIPYKGVHYVTVKNHTYIRAQIFVNNKQFVLGTFETIEDAAKCYNLAAIKYFGEFAYLNQV